MENLTTVSIVHNIDDDIDYWNTCQEQVDAWFVNEYLSDRDIIGSNPQGVCLTFTHDGINFEMVLTEKHIAWLQSELARGLENRGRPVRARRVARRIHRGDRAEGNT